MKMSGHSAIYQRIFNTYCEVQYLFPVIQILQALSIDSNASGNRNAS